MTVILHGFSRGGALAALVVAVAFGVYAFCAALAPRPVPETAPDDAFSAMRAHPHSYIIASEPHEAGTAALEEVRDYIVATLEEYGLEVDVDQRLIVEAHWAREVDTVFGRIPGTDNKHPFMMTAHYDSAVNSFGAADDGAGVIVMLEMARALMAMPRFENDIVFVFTSDEEQGQRSIRTSVEHPWLENMLGVLGFEARGYHGPAYMFETSAGNRFLLKELSGMGAPVVGNSLMFSVYDRAPLSTDFATLKRMGIQGYNLAFVGGFYYYHTFNDSPDNLCPASVQHMGDYAMALVKHYGNWSEPWPTDEPDAVYFNTVGYHMVTYPMNWSSGVAAAALTLLLIGLGLAWRRGLIRIGHTLLAFVQILLSISLATALVGALTYGTYKFLYVYLMYNVAYYQVAGFIVGTGIFFLLAAILLRRSRAAEIYSAGLIFWAIALCIVHWFVPAASHITSWTVLFGAATLALWALLCKTRAEAALGPWLCLGIALPGLAFAGPGMYSLYLMGASLSLPVVVSLWNVLLLLLAPLLLAVFMSRRFSLGLALVALGLLYWGYGITQNGFSPAKPQVTSLSYALNQATGKAGWFSSDAEVNPWTSGFLGKEPVVESLSAILDGKRGRGLYAPAQVVSLPGPEVELLDEREEDGLRILNLRYTSPDKAAEASITALEPSMIREAAVNGQPLLPGGPLWTFRLPVMPRSGVLDLELAIDANSELQLLVHEEFYGLPEVVTRQGGGPMPNWMVPKSNTLGWWESNPIDSNRVWIENQFSFPVSAPEPAPAPEEEAEALPEVPEAVSEVSPEEIPETEEPVVAEEGTEIEEAPQAAPAPEEMPEPAVPVEIPEIEEPVVTEEATETEEAPQAEEIPQTEAVPEEIPAPAESEATPETEAPVVTEDISETEEAPQADAAPEALPELVDSESAP